MKKQAVKLKKVKKAKDQLNCIFTDLSNIP